MATIFIDQQRHTARDGENLLQECLALGFDLPYFCWHPALGSVGACRQCAIKQFKDEHDTHGKIVMACMTAVHEGARISIHDPEASAFRASVIEWLMINHPHDCPVCDEGGECHLQDMTVMTRHVYRRYRGLKRTFRNQDLGPLVNHEMNRCIQCYRCVRFYRDYAGGRDLDAYALRNHVYFGRHADGVLENEFSGNLVEVCPTGVFTDKTLKRHYARKWDLQTAPSVCVHCALGCNTIPGARQGILRRIRNRYNGAVNGYFICDRGRYGYEFVNAPTRIRTPLLKADRREPPRAVTRGEALQRWRALLEGGAKPIGIGSPRASLEANFALRALVGAERFHLGVSDVEHGLLECALALLRAGPARTASLREAENADAVLVLGEDVTNTAPMLALALRQSARQTRLKIASKLHIPHWDDAAVRDAAGSAQAPFFVAAPAATKLDAIAAKVWHDAPDELARLGLAVVSAIDPQAPSVPNLSDAMRTLAEEIARALVSAERPLIVSGCGCGNSDLLRAAARVAAALCAKGRKAQLTFALPECNSAGVALIEGKRLSDALEALREGDADTVIVLENDLYRRAGKDLIDALFAAAQNVIAIDHTATATSAAADIVLPAGTFAESDGTLVNNEGRAQRYFQIYVPAGDIQESWRWVRDLLGSCGRDGEGRWADLDAITAACAAAIPALGQVVNAAPGAAFREAGQKIPREPHRYSGRTAMYADVNVHETQVPADPDSPLAYSMEGYPGEPPPALIPRFWAPGWNSVQSVNKFQSEIAGPLRGGDPGVRLIEPASTPGEAHGGAAPQAFEPRTGAWLLVPLYHIFGSEELSALSPGVRELTPEPYLALHPDDADALHLAAGDFAEVHLDSATRRLAVQVRADLRRGVAGVPVLPDLNEAALPAFARIIGVARA
jgi:NADH-quinone oxidoreductase subunit G